jgi:TRAP-type C4-dicarboxylate transport system substrate-binding protein
MEISRATWGQRSHQKKSMRGRLLSVAALSVAASIVLAGCSTTDTTPAEEAPVIELKLSHTLPEANPVHTATLAVAERIEERTNGTVKIEVFPAGTIGSTKETTEQASLGQAIISYVDASHVSEYGVSELGMLTSPFLLEDYDDANRILQSDLFAEWSDQLATTSNLEILSLNWFAGARHIVGKKPVPEPEDLNGVKIRIPEARTWEIIFGELLPSTPVAVASSEQYSAFQQGVVDAGEIPLKSIVDLGFNEIATDITLTGHLNLFLGYVMPADIFNSMTDEQKSIVLEEFSKGGDEATAATTAGDQDARKLMEADGIKFHAADVKAYRAATAGYFDEFPEWSKETVQRLLDIRDGK